MKVFQITFHPRSQDRILTSLDHEQAFGTWLISQTRFTEALQTHSQNVRENSKVTPCAAAKLLGDYGFEVLIDEQLQSYNTIALSDQAADNRTNETESRAAVPARKV